MSARVTVTPLEATVKTGILGAVVTCRPHSNARIQSLCVDKVRFHQTHVNSLLIAHYVITLLERWYKGMQM